MQNSKEMKKGAKIQITDSAKYNGKDMNWTETFTGVKTIGKGGEWTIHQSDSLISEFLSKEICVHPKEHSENYFVSTATKKEVTEKYNWKKFVYAIFLPEGLKVNTYSDDEYRFELTEDMTVIFCGTVYEARKGMERKMTAAGMKEITTYIQFSDTINPM
jgi:hypothetical protein